ncbi:MAG: antibiotic biosynthesis monooxygenase [Flavobacterium sp.]|nr:MAG: antibiotic biosynthesis monooxygenase [Flavobacterium sp.]
MKIYLTAVIKSKSQYLEEVTSVLKQMVVQTRKETACLQYDLHQDINDKNIFVFYEIWENQQGLDLHNEQPYIKEFGTLANHKLETKPMIYLTEIITL